MENKMDIENTTLKEKVLPENPMKQWLVNYVGETYSIAVEKHNSEEQEKMEWDGNVTVEMIVESMSLEFPEFVMALAEENFIRGYEQAIQDTLEGFKLADEAAQADAEE
jgi:selenophosphate synthetase-related protein